MENKKECEKQTTYRVKIHDVNKKQTNTMKIYCMILMRPKNKKF